MTAPPQWGAGCTLCSVLKARLLTYAPSSLSPSPRYRRQISFSLWLWTAAYCVVQWCREPLWGHHKKRVEIWRKSNPWGFFGRECLSIRVFEHWVIMAYHGPSYGLSRECAMKVRNWATHRKCQDRFLRLNSWGSINQLSFPLDPRFWIFTVCELI